MAKVYTLPHQTGCLAWAAQQLHAWAQQQSNPLSIHNVWVFVPSPRIAQALQHQCAVAGMPILCRIVPLTSQALPPEVLTNAPNTPHISAFCRQNIMAKMLKAKNPTQNWQHSFTQAQGLVQLHTELTQYNKSIKDLQDFIPTGFATHWREVLDFLKIALHAYPAVLQDLNVQDPTIQTKTLLQSLVEYITNQRQNIPTWAVGFTDTTPSGLTVLQAIAKTKSGQLVIPAITQKPSQNLVNQLGVDASEIQNIPLPKPQNTITVLPCETAGDEILATALKVKKEIERGPEEGIKIAVVTRNQAFAKQLQTALWQWHIVADDSAGTPLTSTPQATLLLQCLKSVSQGLSIPLLLDILNSPLWNETEDQQEDWQNALTKLEKDHLRGKTEKLELEPFLRTLPADLQEIFAPIWTILRQFHSSPKEIPAENLLNLIPTECLNGETGETLKEAIQNWQTVHENETCTGPQIYAGLRMITDATAIRRRDTTPNVFIWGPMEARLQSIDICIVPQAEAAHWPGDIKPSPWLHPALREELNLPNAAHYKALSELDFAGLSEHPNVTFTYVKGQDISPFLQTYAPQMQVEQDILDWVEQIKQTNTAQAHPQAIGQLDAEHQPRKWSATTVGKLMTCPYQIYAEKGLNLKPWPPLGEEETALHAGNIIHNWLQGLLEPTGNIQPLGRISGWQDAQKVKNWLQNAAPHAVNNSQVEHKAQWLQRLMQLTPIVTRALCEMAAAGRWIESVEQTLELSFGNVTLEARADRLDGGSTGLWVVDYKTGSPPSKDDMKTGKAPQLPLEAWLYWQLKGTQPQGVSVWRLAQQGRVNGAVIDVEELDYETITEGLTHLRQTFAAEQVNYLANPGKSQCTYCQFAGICRKAEWEHEAAEEAA